MKNYSQEKYAERLNGLSFKKAVLSQEDKDVLQEMIDKRCRLLTDCYIEERNKLSEEYLKDMLKPEFRASLSQYHELGSDPRSVLYSESFERLFQGHRDALRQLKHICETLALKTNPLLDRVLGCNVQSHKCEPQD